MMSNLPNKKGLAELGRIVKPGQRYYCRITSAKTGNDNGEGLRVSAEPFDQQGDPVPAPQNSNEERATIKLSFYDSPDQAARKQGLFITTVLWEGEENGLVGTTPQDLVERWFIGVFEYKTVRKKNQESGEWEDTGDERCELVKAEPVKKNTPEYDFCVNLAGNFYGDASIPDLDPEKIGGATAAAAADTKTEKPKTATQTKKAEKAEKAAAGVAQTASAPVDASNPFDA